MLAAGPQLQVLTHPLTTGPTRPFLAMSYCEELSSSTTPTNALAHEHSYVRLSLITICCFAVLYCSANRDRTPPKAGMGGRLFSKGANPLYIPRLAPPIYKHVYSQLSTTLNSLFPCVSKPVEGPAKLSFGDIDLLVNLEGSAFNQEQKEDPTRTDIWTAVEKALRPERIYYERSKVIDVKSLAVPWPKDLSPDQMRLQLAVEPEVPLELLENAKAQAQAQAQTKAAELSETDEQSRSPASGEAAAGASQENDVQPDDTAPVLVARYIQVDIRLCDTTQDLEWHKL